MPRELPLAEEIEYAEKLTDPQAVYPLETLTDEARLAGEILERPSKQVSLLSGLALEDPAVAAGLTPEYAEYIVRGGSLPQKSGFVELLDDEENVAALREIAKKLDLDLGVKSRAHQDRVEELIRYFSDVYTAISDDRNEEAFAEPINVEELIKEEELE